MFRKTNTNVFCAMLCKFLYFAVTDVITLTLVKGSNEGCFGGNCIYKTFSTLNSSPKMIFFFFLLRITS